MIRVKHERGKELNNCISLPEDPVPTLNWVFENQSIVSRILTQPKAEKKVNNRGIQVVIWLYIFTIDLLLYM